MAEDAPRAVEESEVVDIEAAAKKVTQGKSIIDDDPHKASELLCEAMRAYEKHYGADSIECAPVYVYYGIAMYEIARNNFDALGGAKTTVEPMGTKGSGKAAPPAVDSAAEKASDKTDAPAEAGDKDGEDGKVAAAAEPPAKAAQEQTEDADKEDVAGEGLEAGHADADAEAGDGDDDGDEGGDDEEGSDNEGSDGDDDGEATGEEDMKLAWDMLELARVIYDRHQPEQHHERLAEVHRALGDIKGEQGRFEEAVECYNQSLSHLEAMQPRDVRRIAEVQYSLATAFTYLEQLEEALNATTAAQSNLEVAVAATEEELAALPTDGSGGEAAEAAGRRLQQLCDDLRGVIAELGENASGLRESIANNKSLKELLRQAFIKANCGAAAAEGGPAAAGGGTAGSAAAAADGTLMSKNAFAAPSKAASAAPAVSLGTVGRGSKRITLQPTNTNTAVTAGAPAGAGAQPAGKGALAPAPAPKRTLQDLMDGASGGETTIGFSAVAVEETREDGAPPQQQAAKKARTEEVRCSAPAEADER